MKSILILFYILAPLVKVTAQSNCDCLENLTYLTAKVSKNYSGYKDKVTDKNEFYFLKTVDSLLGKVSKTNGVNECYKLLKIYIDLFKDNHLQLNLKRIGQVPPQAEKNPGIEFKTLNDSTIFLKITSLKIKNKAIVDSIIYSNRNLLNRTPNWILDFRNNHGGVTDVFNSLLPYLFTKPFISKGSSNLLTPDNVERFSFFLEKNRKLLDSNTIIKLEEWIKLGKARPNSWHIEKTDTTVYPSVLKFPKKVIILVNKNTASSAETFLLISKGISDKVRIAGENSGKFLDYGNLLPYEMPCRSFSLSIPSRRANYLNDGISYDKNGFPPDIRIKDSEKDWVKYALKLFNKRSIWH